MRDSSDETKEEAVPDPVVVVSIDKKKVTGIKIEVGQESVPIKNLDALIKLRDIINRAIKGTSEEHVDE